MTIAVGLWPHGYCLVFMQDSWRTPRERLKRIYRAKLAGKPRSGSLTLLAIP